MFSPIQDAIVLHDREAIEAEGYRPAGDGSYEREPYLDPFNREMCPDRMVPVFWVRESVYRDRVEQ